MSVALDEIGSFLAMQGRILDRRRFDVVTGRGGDAAATLQALNAYRNADGGYGRGLEPDLRALESQPAGALHAFEVLAELRPQTSDEAVALCDWLDAASLPDGGLPFALPLADPSGCAPFWAGAETDTSSLHISAAVAAQAHEVGAHDRRVALHPWLRRCTRFCLAAIDALEGGGHALELMFCVRFLDAVHDVEPEAPKLMARLGGFLPASGLLHVAGGRDDEMMRPLDFAPRPERPARRLFDASVIEAELDRLEAARASDGGWPLEWDSYSPAAAVEWRGYVTVGAVKILRANGRLED